MFRGIVAIVSGGASGLGAATASHLARNGARGVIVADLPSSRDRFERMLVAEKERTAAGAGEAGVSSSCCASALLKFAEVDVTDEDQVSAALDMAENEFGDHVNAAINCAGVAPARKTLSAKRNDDDGTIEVRRIHPLSEFSMALNVNAAGSFNLARLAADRMARRPLDPGASSGADSQRGCIVNTASIAAYEGQIGQVAYAASKGAIVGMTLPMARELAPLGIRVVTIAPGLFRTPLLDGLPEKVKNELGATVPYPSRLGEPSEFANLVGTILLTPYLNGEVIRLDGALRMPPS